MATWARTTRTTRCCSRAIRRTSGASTTAMWSRCLRSSSAVTHDPEAAADLTAETFAAALVARGRYQARATPAAAWLFAIAQHKLSDFRRRGSAEHRMRARLGMEPVAVGAADAELIRWLGEEVATQMRRARQVPARPDRPAGGVRALRGGAPAARRAHRQVGGADQQQQGPRPGRAGAPRRDAAGDPQGDGEQQGAAADLRPPDRVARGGVTDDPARDARSGAARRGDRRPTGARASA